MRVFKFNAPLSAIACGLAALASGPGSPSALASPAPITVTLHQLDGKGQGRKELDLALPYWVPSPTWT